MFPKSTTNPLSPNNIAAWSIVKFKRIRKITTKDDKSWCLNKSFKLDVYHKKYTKNPWYQDWNTYPPISLYLSLSLSPSPTDELFLREFCKGEVEA